MQPSLISVPTCQFTHIDLNKNGISTGLIKSGCCSQQWFNASCSFVWLEAPCSCITPNTHPNSAYSAHQLKSWAFPEITPLSRLHRPFCVYTPRLTSQLGSFTYTQCGKTKTGNEIQASNCCQGDGSVVSAVTVNALINLGENEWKLIELSVKAEWPQKTEPAHSRHVCLCIIF